MSFLPRPGARVVAGLAIAAVVALAAVTSALSVDPEAAEDGSERATRRLNVVVVMTDDQEAASVRAMRAVRRKLADRGTTFTRGFATFPLCCPSRVTFLTGQYAHNHGVVSNRPPPPMAATTRSGKRPALCRCRCKMPVTARATSAGI